MEVTTEIETRKDYSILCIDCAKEQRTALKVKFEKAELSNHLCVKCARKTVELLILHINEIRLNAK